eukprot:TRINITY_DN6320_c1_g1_i1.p1 TRINITY_DN6320_c1_g1~~TRINITY_DN6320_c1_g1_i1.p1  ORF type:complete len:1790 (-),score=679.77 TRINITY_DN6320_c1_g1_i1:91-5460(-)
MANKAKLKLKLPGDPGVPKSTGKLNNLKKGDVLTKIAESELLELLGKKSFPCSLDFSPNHFQLENDTFLEKCDNIVKDLWINNNQLKSLDVSKLTKLKRLDSSNNALEKINCKGLQQLEYLDISQNRLEELPDFQDLKTLININLSGNRITRGFSELANLKALRVIDLGRNSIDFSLQQFFNFIIKPLQKLTKLEYVSFQDNPVEVKIIKCKFLCINDLPKIKYYDWKLITKEERTLAKKYDSQGKWKDRENKPEPINATKGPKITGGSISITLPTINLPQDNSNKQNESSKTQDKFDEITDNNHNNNNNNKSKRISQLVGANDSLVNFLLGNENDPINDIMNELNGNRGSSDNNSDPLSMYLESGDGGHDPLAEIINYLEEQPEEKDSKIKGGGNYEDELLKIIYGDTSGEVKENNTAKIEKDEFSDVDDIFLQITTELNISKEVQTPRKGGETKKDSKDTDLDDLLLSIASDFISNEDDKSTGVYTDIEKIIASSNETHDIGDGDNDDALDFLLQGALEHDKKVEEERVQFQQEKEKLKRDTMLQHEQLEFQKRALKEEKENEENRLKQEKENLELERLKVEEEKEMMRKERENQLLEQKQKLQEERRQFEEEQKRLFEEQRQRLQEEQRIQLQRQKEQLEEEQRKILDEQRRKMEEEIEIKKKEIEEAKKQKQLVFAQKEQEEQERLRKEREIELNKILQKQEEEERRIEKRNLLEKQKLEREQQQQIEKLQIEQEKLANEQKQQLIEQQKQIFEDDDEVMNLLNGMLEGSSTDVKGGFPPEHDNHPKVDEGLEEQANEVLSMLENEEKTKTAPVKQPQRGLQRGSSLLERPQPNKPMERSTAIPNYPNTAPKKLFKKVVPEKKTPPQNRGLQRGTQTESFKPQPQEETTDEEPISTGDDELDKLLVQKPSTQNTNSNIMANIKWTDLQLSQRLGVGTFGTSFKGICRKKEVTIKKLKVQRFADRFIQQFLQEAEILGSVKHPNLAPFYGACVDNQLCTIQQFIKGGNLFGYLRQKGNTIDFQFIVNTSKQVASALQYLHKHEIIHRNLCSKNIIITSQSQAVLNDYGLFFVKDSVYQTAMGYPEYESPEVLERDPKITTAADVFSYGVLLWELFARETPYSGLNPIQIKNSVVQTELRPSIIPDTPFVFQKLMAASWNTEAEKRPTMEVIVKILSKPLEELGKFAKIQKEEEENQNEEGNNNGENQQPQLSEEEASQKISAITEKALVLLQRPEVLTQQKALTAISNIAKTYVDHLAHLAELVPFVVDKISLTGDAKINELACDVLNLLGENEECSTEFRESVGFPALLELLSSSDIQIILRALKTITTLVKKDENKEAIRFVGGIVPIMKLMRVKNEFIRGQALWAISLLLENRDNQNDFCEAGGVPVLISLLQDKSPPLVLRVLVALGYLVTNDQVYTQLKNTGVIERFLQLLQSKSPLLQSHAINAVVTFAEKDDLRTKLITSGGLPFIINLLNSEKQEIRTKSLETLLLLSTDASCHQALYTDKALDPILRMTVSKVEEIQIPALNFVSNCCENQGLTSQLRVSGGLPILVALMVRGSEQVAKIASSSFLSAIKCDPASLETACNSGIEKKLPQILKSTDEEILSNTLEILALLTENKSFKEKLVTSGVIDVLIDLLDSEDDSIREKSANVLAFCSDFKDVRSKIFNSNKTGFILSFINSEDIQLKNRIFWSISHFSSDQSSHPYIVENVLSSIVDSLSSDDTAILSVCLKTILILAQLPHHRPTLIEHNFIPALEGLLETNGVKQLRAAAEKAILLINSD